MSITLIYTLIFLTPFIFASNTAELFEFPKMHFVYVLGSLLITLSLWESIRKRNFIYSKNFLPAMLLFVVSFILSTVASVHKDTSVWGYYSRFNGGLVSVLIFFGIYFFSLRQNLSLNTVLKTVTFSLIPISIYSFIQHLALSTGWSSDTTVRAFSTFGQPNWFAAYCSMVLPIPIYFSLIAQKTRSKTGWLGIFILGFCGFWFSYSVSGIIGFFVSVTLLIVLNLKLVKTHLKELTITLSICLLFAMLNPGIFGQRISDVFADVHTVLRPAKPVADTSQTSYVPATEVAPNYNVSDSGSIRAGMWKGTINLWLSSPKVFLIGTGPETFPYEFQFFRPASLNYTSEWNYILNKPHNYYLELLAQNGIFGLLVYLVIIIKVSIKRHPILTPALSGLFITNIFGWPTVSTCLLFWVFLSLLDKPLMYKIPHPPKGLPLMLAGSLSILTIYFNLLVVRRYTADVLNKEADRYFALGDINKALELSDYSIKYNPQEAYYYRQRAKFRIPQTLNADDNTLIGDLQKSVSINSKNLATLRGEVPLYYYLSQKDPTYIQPTKAFYNNLTSIYPNDVGVITLVAKYQKLLGLGKDYQLSVERVRELRPDLLEWYLK